MASAGKAALREQLLAARRLVAEDVRAAEAGMSQPTPGARGEQRQHGLRLRAVGTEPGSIEMLDVLLHRARPSAAAGRAHHQ